ncbi:MAG: DNA polymerase III, subunit gamma and tau [Actinobacteria bacterium]|jgi:DNA polymerase-3 subunit gamma/tau|nr:DNA polymerase III, subunit gamma and tau [Actinomycetota bacterium]|tara:strand:+ start:2807 stop:4342 length:1536 start_codon:yes stop_codon:yes gene_type:complete
MQEAFYRKYRPASLDELVGQSEAVKLIQQQVKNDNLSHAYLFSGPRGVGKTSLARIIATTLGCDPVFDITEIDAASHNKVDDIRDLNDSINFIASSPGNKRVFILDEVHMLSNAASNAFLKTLEEPPGHVIFILATTEPDRVIETIKSRTTHIAFKRISNEEIVTTLSMIAKSEKIKISSEVLKYISNQSEGSLRDAINLLEQTHNTFGDKANIDDLYSILGKVSNVDMFKIIESINGQDTSEVLNILQSNYNKGLQPLDILNSLTGLFRNIFYFKYLPDDINYLNISENEKDLVKNSNEYINARELSRILDILDELNQSIQSAPSQELKLELFLLKLIKPELASDIKSISRRVDLLEGEKVLKPLNKTVEKVTDNIQENKTTKKKINEEPVSPQSSPKDIGNFDVYWPKVLQKAKDELTPRKYSYLTLVSPEIENQNKLILFINQENEYLISELNKSNDIKEFILSCIEKMMGIRISIEIKAIDATSERLVSEDGFQDNINEVFDIKSID